MFARLLSFPFALAATPNPDQTIVDSSAFSGVIDAITNQINVTTIVGILAGAAAVCVGLAFLWWGARKVISMIMSAFKKGRVSV